MNIVLSKFYIQLRTHIYVFTYACLYLHNMHAGSLPKLQSLS